MAGKIPNSQEKSIRASLKPMPLFLRTEIQPDIPIFDQYSDEMVFD